MEARPAAVAGLYRMIFGTRRARIYLVFTTALTIAAVVLLAITRDAPRPEAYMIHSVPAEILDRIQFYAIALVGALVWGNRPSNRLGWVLCIMGLGFPLEEAAEGWARYAFEVNPDLPGAVSAAWLTNWTWALTIFLLPFVLLLFPNGKLLSRRWRPVAWIGVANLAYCVFVVMLTDRRIDGFPQIENPTFLIDLGPTPSELVGPSFPLMLVILILGVVSVFLRFRRAAGEERAQIKWVLYASAIFGLYFTATIVLGLSGFANVIVGIMVSMTMTGAMGIAILKYRLYDIDVVINKTLVFGALATFITGIYVAVVVGVGELLGSSDEPNLALSIAATAIVAIAFQPVRDRVERVANRLVYGIRRTPYEVLAEFSERVATSYETQEVTPAMAHTLQEATGAARAEVWLALDSTLVLSASTESERTGDDVIALQGSGIDAIDADEVVAVTHHDELLGALAIAKDRAEPVTAADRRLLADLAAQAGIVLRNARLTAELQARLDEISVVAEQIRESRRRIVAAQDQARRRLERDIHDGAQQHLVALAVKLNLARTMAERKPERAGAMLDQLDTEMGDALGTLSDLARGIYPPLLRERGIAAALEARGASAPFELAVIDRTSARADEATEAAIYFCCLEALQNVAKYAGATSVTVELDDVEGGLSFRVSDDGRGFAPDAVEGGSGLQGMSDRLAAVGGVVEIQSQPGRGTTVRGRLRMSSRAVLESSS